MFPVCFQLRGSITFACAFLHEYQLYITQPLRVSGIMKGFWMHKQLFGLTNCPNVGLVDFPTKMRRRQNTFSKQLIQLNYFRGNLVKNYHLYRPLPDFIIRCGRRVSTQFLVFPISTRVDITACISTRKKCFIFLKCQFKANVIIPTFFRLCIDCAIW